MCKFMFPSSIVRHFRPKRYESSGISGRCVYWEPEVVGEMKIEAAFT